MTISTIRPPWWPASRGCYSPTWKALAKAVSASFIVPFVLLVVGSAALSMGSSAGDGKVTNFDAHALEASDARDLERMDSDRG